MHKTALISTRVLPLSDSPSAFRPQPQFCLSEHSLTNPALFPHEEMPTTTIQQGDCFATLPSTHYAWLSRTSPPASNLQTVQTILVDVCETLLLLALILTALRTRTLTSHNHKHWERTHSAPKLHRTLILATAGVSTLYALLAFLLSLADGAVGWGIWRASPHSRVLCDGADAASVAAASFGALLFVGLAVPFCVAAVVATADVFRDVVGFGRLETAAVAVAVGHPCSLAAVVVAVRPALEQGEAKIVAVPVLLGVGFGLSGFAGFAAVRSLFAMRMRKADEEDQAEKTGKTTTIEDHAMAPRLSDESMPEKKSESSEEVLDDLMREITGYGLDER